MSEGVNGGGAAGGVALPRAHVLSYVTTAGTPTRVRKVASVGVMVIGILLLAFTALVAVPVASMDFRIAHYMQEAASRGGWVRVGGRFRPGPPPAHVPSLGYFLMVQGYRDLVRIGVLLLAGTVSVLMVLSGRKIWEGKAWVCRGVAVLLWAPAVVLFLLSVWAGGHAVVYGTRLAGYRAYPGEWEWGLLLVLTVPGLLLHFDLMRFLWWIARNPVEEKPRVGFLPAGG
ncbi:MAG: hypothetical protein ACTHN5_06470 [Phycisphaerae bacterium]